MRRSAQTLFDPNELHDGEPGTGKPRSPKHPAHPRTRQSGTSQRLSGRNLATATTSALRSYVLIDWDLVLGRAGRTARSFPYLDKSTSRPSVASFLARARRAQPASGRTAFLRFASRAEARGRKDGHGSRVVEPIRSRPFTVRPVIGGAALQRRFTATRDLVRSRPWVCRNHPPSPVSLRTRMSCSGFQYRRPISPLPLNTLSISARTPRSYNHCAGLYASDATTFFMSASIERHKSFRARWARSTAT
jgi:hypothetical protein